MVNGIGTGGEEWEDGGVEDDRGDVDVDEDALRGRGDVEVDVEVEEVVEVDGGIPSPLPAAGEPVALELAFEIEAVEETEEAKR